LILELKTVRKKIQKLFENYSKIEVNVENIFEATNVGLLVSKKIIEKHGSNLFVESEINKGNIFYFFLSIVKE